ncbi:magnesium transporter [Natronoglycomyces albus]|uniref:Magnesium transporter MgtE n=1 Tax=Natronoglycomyces albus TaxID=2811108 RepID=A0A895XMH6_9ACTN|nr:magnesium transporter [Natronoglycomyces albus]QSB06554.1 magnesium transporter [Natronoglycomyces albus]
MTPNSIPTPISPAAVDNLTALRDELAAISTVEIAEEFPRWELAEQALRFRLLSKDRAIAVFEELDPIHQQELLDALREESVLELLETMEADDRAKLLDEMPAKVATRLQARLSPAERRATAKLLGYEPESAGRIMTPGFVSLRSSMSAAEAIERLRHLPTRPRHLDVLPVTDGFRKLLGVVDLPHLVTAAPETQVAEVMSDEHHSIRTDADQEDAARLMQEANLVALPVVDFEDRLVGMITVDDAMEILEAEDTEDISRAGGSEPLERPYLAASVLLLARKRATWLLILTLAAVLTVGVLDSFEAELAAAPVLALFVPLLIGTGGNSGSQAATTVIRAMAVGEVRFSDIGRIIWREGRVGFVLGLMLASVGFPLVSLIYSLELGTVVALTLVAICTWATLAGSFLPLLAKKVGIDPAVVSAPMIATLCDATGLLLYFSIAIAVLGPTL